MKQLIGLSGYSGSGKDTVADYLVVHHGYCKIAFADALRWEVGNAFGVSIDRFLDRTLKEKPTELLRLSRCNNYLFVAHVLRHQPNTLNQDRSPREVLILWGRYRASVSDTYFVDELAICLKDIPSPVVIPDVRFIKEANFVLGTMGELWNVVRDVPAMHGREYPAIGVEKQLLNQGTKFELALRIEELLRS